jgi:homocysteine S-methyltransferase
VTSGSVPAAFFIPDYSRRLWRCEKRADRAHSSKDRPAERPFAIGINCTKVYKLRDLIQIFESASKEQNLVLPRLVIYPDGASGLIYDPVTQKWVRKAESDADDTSKRRDWHEEVADIVRQVRDRGAWKGILVGGCCKTRPGHIAALMKSLE